MKINLPLLTVVYGLLASVALAQAPGQPPLPPATDTAAPNIPGVVAGGTKVQVIKDGFVGTEGPIPLPDGTIIFTHPGQNRIRKINKDGSTATFLENTNGSNGLAFDSTGRLISAQANGIGILYPKGSEKTLLDNCDGKRFGRPNDLVVDKKGGVYFTDPVGFGPDAPKNVTPAVYYRTPGGKCMKVAEGINRPNGVQLSSNEKILYVNDTAGEYVFAFDIQPDGTLKNRRNFARLQGVQKTDTGVNSGADGLAIDSKDRVYVCTMTGVQVFSPKGEPLGTIPLSRPPQNLAFGGSDKKTLYVVGRGAAYKVQMLAQGFKGRVK